MNNKPLIFGFGQCALDYLGLIDDYPPPDVKCEFTDLVIQGGGPVATALAALTRWGFSGYLAGVTGDDEPGALIKQSLSDEGVDIGGLQTRRGASSQIAFIMSEPETARRTIFWRRPTGKPLSPDEIDENVLLRAAAVHTDGLFADAALHACRLAKNAGIPVIVDAGTLRDGMLDLARVSDCFVTSEKFSDAMSGDPEKTCRMLEQMGVRIAGVTLGAKGYVTLIDGTLSRHDAFPARAMDTTGCGDVFHAGLTYGLVRGWPMLRAFELGAWAAARVSEHMGGRLGIPTKDQIESRFSDPVV